MSIKNCSDEGGGNSRRLIGGVKKFLASLGWAALLSLTLLVPEWLFSRMLEGYTPYWERAEVTVVYLLILFLINSYYRRTALVLAGALFLLQFSAFVYYSYFGSFYGPAHVMLLFLDAGEVISSAAGVFRYLLLPVLIVGVAFAVYCWLHVRVQGTLLRSRASFVFLALLLIAPSINARLEDNSQRYEPDATSLGIKNALYAVSYFVGSDLPKRISGEYAIRSYQPYRVQPVQVGGQYHVVVVMGESLAPSHMSLFGYERDTTPYLVSLRDDPAFVHRLAVSSAVSTRVSIPMFMNVQYEPDNWSHIPAKESSLFNLAKRSGFQTAYLTIQELDGISSLLSSADIDHWRDHRDRGDCGYDDCLISYMKALPIAWERPAFLVLNQRSAHSPYDGNYPAEFARYSADRDEGYAQFMVDSYDDAMRYVDRNVQDIVAHLASVSRLPVLLVMTSDHGQKLGEDGRFGHNTLDFGSARVPFMFYGINAPDELLGEMRAQPQILTHYEIGKLVARLLGHHIANPNEQAGAHYLNGVDIMGRAGFMAYRLNDLPEYQVPALAQAK